MSVPMYKKIQQDLFHLIASGQLREGDRIPSESELISQYYVSAITVKNALNALADQGLIARIKGKGSFVIQSPYSVPRMGSSTPPRIHWRHLSQRLFYYGPILSHVFK